MPVSNEWLLATAKDLFGDDAWVHVSRVPKGHREAGRWCAYAYAGDSGPLRNVAIDYQPSREMATRMLLSALQAGLAIKLAEGSSDV